MPPASFQPSQSAHAAVHLVSEALKQRKATFKCSGRGTQQAQNLIGFGVLFPQQCHLLAQVPDLHVPFRHLFRPRKRSGEQAWEQLFSGWSVMRACTPTGERFLLRHGRRNSAPAVEVPSQRSLAGSSGWTNSPASIHRAVHAAAALPAFTNPSMCDTEQQILCCANATFNCLLVLAHTKGTLINHSPVITMHT